MLNALVLSETPARRAPGLVADVLYLRPAERSGILLLLAELGIFVRESREQRAADVVFPGGAADILVMFADRTPDHLSAVRDAVTLGDRVVVAVVPAEADQPSMLQVGAAYCTSDVSGASGLRDLLRAAGAEARLREPAVAPGSRGLVFGCLEFRHTPPELARGRASAPLSPVEFGLLEALVEAPGGVMAKEELRLRLARQEGPMSEGYLKAVVLRLRRKAASIGGDPGRLEAIRGTGYILRS